MMKQPYAGKCHRDIILITGIDDMVVPNRAPWLDNRTDTAPLCSDDVIAKRKKGI